MKETQDYLRDLAEIRSMMERSSKFLSLSGWAGIMAGLYALAGAHIAFWYLDFKPAEVFYTTDPAALRNVIILGIAVLVLAITNAVFVSKQKARKKGESAWNPVSRKMLADMAVPLVTGGLLLLIFISQGMLGLLIPVTLIFYGLALHSGGRYTFTEIGYMGLVQILLGVLSILFIEYSIFIWAAGFGGVHILYGVYMFTRYGK
ncbi:MAG: hypothetical protein L6Q47_07555 [Ignavibacteriaceae bacterium]|nr:hypothetical protein [Ignavibacteriaceae bacterium]